VVRLLKPSNRVVAGAAAIARPHLVAVAEGRSVDQSVISRCVIGSLFFPAIGWNGTIAVDEVVGANNENTAPNQNAELRVYVLAALCIALFNTPFMG